MFEEKKPNSWLNSVSAFANGWGGSLLLGIGNDGIVKGLDGICYRKENIDYLRTIYAQIKIFCLAIPEHHLSFL